MTETQRGRQFSQPAVATWSDFAIVRWKFLKIDLEV